MAIALARSWPIGFSSITRVPAPARPAAPSAFADRRVEARRGRQVIDHVAVAQCARIRVGQRAPRAASSIERRGLVVQAFEEARDAGIVAVRAGHALAHGASTSCAESVVGRVRCGPCRGCATTRQQIVAEQAVERGQQHALRQVAGGAEDGQQGSGSCAHAVIRGECQSVARAACAARPAYVCRSPAPIHKKPRRMARRGWGILRLRPLRGLRSGQSDISVRQNL
jgi:hypothetical protein